jgi:hypothetical protein
MCNAPKFQKTEKRTGAGGGFNEREGVEYKEKVDSDDEYDEVKKRENAFFANFIVNLILNTST